MNVIIVFVIKAIKKSVLFCLCHVRNIRTSLVLLRLGAAGPVLRSTITISLSEHSISGGPLKAVKQLGELPIMLNIEGRVMVTYLGSTVGERSTSKAYHMGQVYVC